MNIQIRRALAQDGPGIARVRVLAWQHAYRGLLPDTLLNAMDIQQEGQKWRDGLGNLPSDRSIFIAEEIERTTSSDEVLILGFCACSSAREKDPLYSAEISALYVLPACQRKGVGRLLINAAIDWLRQQGHKKMIIYVLRDNFPARSFYEALGGKLARERMWDIQGMKMPEVGYGYDLAS